jgi:hypothetical protein
MNIKNTFLLCIFLISCNAGSNSKQENPRKSKSKPKVVLKDQKSKKPPLKTNLNKKTKSKTGSKVEKIKAVNQPFEKDGVLINEKEIIFKKWGVKTKYSKEFAKSLKKRTKPVLYKKTNFRKYSEEVYSFNYKYSYFSNLFIDLRKIYGPVPKKLMKFEKYFDGTINGKTGVKGKLKYGVGIKRVRGPGHCSRGRCRHMLVDQLNGYVIFQQNSKSYVKCHVYVTRESDIKAKKFNEYFDLCKSIRNIK